MEELDETAINFDRSVYQSCPFQKECWKDIRRPKIRAAAKEGIKVYLPYICSFQTEGDIEKCGHHEDYVARENVSINDSSGIGQ